MSYGPNGLGVSTYNESDEEFLHRVDGAFLRHNLGRGFFFCSALVLVFLSVTQTQRSNPDEQGFAPVVKKSYGTLHSRSVESVGKGKLTAP